MDTVFLRTLYAHMEWADALVWQTVLNEPSASRDDYVVDSLVHLHLVQRAWLAIWVGEEIAMPTRADFGELAEVRDWGRSYHPEADRFFTALTEERLQEPIDVPWTEFIEKEIGGPPTPARLGDAIYQVPAHSAHHRAQVQARIRAIGGHPPMVDYIGWIWRGQPGASW